MFFGPLGVAVASLGEDGTGLGAFRVLICSVCACLDMSVFSITKTRLFKYTEHFISKN